MAVTSVYDGPSNAHPIITLNALKNIIGDDRQNPSQLLLDALENLAEKYPQRTYDKVVLDAVAKEGLGLTVFISDLEDACQSGNPIEMEQEAARLQWVSENGLAVIDCLLEVALQDFDRLGLFIYHLQRANAFSQDVKNTWPYTRCMLKEISKSPLPEPHGKMDDVGWEMDHVPNDSVQLNKMAAARRLWNGDYVRIEGYRREISHWFSTVSVEMGSEKNIMNGLEDYVKNGSNFFIELAEGLIGNPLWETKIIQLEALRYFAKNASLKDLPTISSHLKELIK
ncbi:MAG: hypothetical protein ISR89_00595 [Candidatus Marinimicrobia bacterium]|nr:hypothetical protein [Candidatus Neomarinimicrobiota bacterium]MBL7029649.1 hypothetical protein [Candidatus Neomarinimicrobiota bacterium]